MAYNSAIKKKLNLKLDLIRTGTSNIQNLLLLHM